MRFIRQICRKSKLSICHSKSLYLANLSFRAKPRNLKIDSLLHSEWLLEIPSNNTTQNDRIFFISSDKQFIHTKFPNPQFPYQSKQKPLEYCNLLFLILVTLLSTNQLLQVLIYHPLVKDNSISFIFPIPPLA